MKVMRAVNRKVLDERLLGLASKVGPCPPRGWIFVIRAAIGMSTFELGQRMGVTASRVSQLERAEADGSIRLSALERSAAALNCKVCYVVVPNESLQDMVLRRALKKAAEAIARSRPHMAALVDEAMHSDDPSSPAA
ncbi:MAG TPA: hypothetical protein VIX84_01205, partial [Acidimicrobiales bacterium]